MRKANGKYFTYSFLDNQSRHQRRTDRKQRDSETPGWVSSRFNVYHFIYLGCKFLNEKRLQTMFHGNYITGGVFNINLSPANEVKSPEVDQKRKERKLIIESDGSQEFATWCSFKIHFCCYRIFLFFMKILTFWNRKYKYYCLCFSFITLYPSFITFLWLAFCDSWPL